MKQLLLRNCCWYSECSYLANKKVGGKKLLKALLYGELPVSKTKYPQKEHSRLAHLIQNHLDENGIGVQVKVANPLQIKKLFQPSEINQLWYQYDIIQIDTMMIKTIKQQLLQIRQSEFKSFHNIFDVQWVPLVKNITNRKQKIYIGSPGFLCSYFIFRRQGGSGQMVIDFKEKYPLVFLYTNIFLNISHHNKIENMDYHRLDYNVIQFLKQFLKECQQDSSVFDYKNNFCFNPQKCQRFYTEKLDSTTTGFSQNLYNFIAAFGESQNYSVQYIMKQSKRKMMYLSSFIAKNTAQRESVIKFYNAMHSDEIVRIYTKGLYTDQPGKSTYLLPPTKSIFQEVKSQDKYYKAIYNELFHPSSQLLPIYHQNYCRNISSLYTKIIEALQQSSPLPKEAINMVDY